MYHQIIANTPGYVFYKDSELCYMGGNLNFIKLADLRSEKELIGKTDYDIPWKQFAEKYRDDDLKAINGATVENIEFAQGTEKSLVKVYTRKQPIIFKDTIVGVVGYARPIDMLTQDADLESFKPIQLDKNDIKQYFSGLSVREAQCIFYVIRGHSMTSIAEILSLSPRTVEDHINNIKNKLGAKNRRELITAMLAQGFNEMIPPGIIEL